MIRIATRAFPTVLGILAIAWVVQRVAVWATARVFQVLGGLP